MPLVLCCNVNPALLYNTEYEYIFYKFEHTLFTQDIFPDNVSKYGKLWQSNLTHNEITCQKMNEMSTLDWNRRIQKGIELLLKAVLLIYRTASVAL